MSDGMDASVLREYLTGYVEWEGVARWLVVPETGVHDETVPLPARWSEALCGKATLQRRLALLWNNLDAWLPRTCNAYIHRTKALALLETAERGWSLIYVFEADGDMTARRGFAPVRHWPAIASRLPVDLKPLYELHDGLVNIMSYDGGPLPCAQWQILADPYGSEAGLVKIATDGSDAFGFDLSEAKPKAYAILPDEQEVNQIADPWKYIDDLIAARVELF